MSKQVDVVVIAGGWSEERAVSLRSGAAVFKACQNLGLQAELMDIVTEGDMALLDALPKHIKVFNAIHGHGGEDGVMSAYLDKLGLAYTGSGYLASELAMDKYRSKLAFEASGLPVLTSRLLDAEKDLEGCDDWSYPLCFKPNTQGSSVGVYKVTQPEECAKAFAGARAFAPVLVEPWIEGVEYTVGWVEGKALPVIRIESNGHEFYDYEAKYESTQTAYHIPCGLDDALIEQLQTNAIKAIEALGCRGWARVDYMMDLKDNTPYLLEVNTIPGMTVSSLVPKAAAAAGLSFEDLVARILAAATCDAI